MTTRIWVCPGCEQSSKTEISGPCFECLAPNMIPYIPASVHEELLEAAQHLLEGFKILAHPTIGIRILRLEQAIAKCEKGK